MNKKMRASIIAVVAALFAFAIVVAPKTAYAAEIYSDTEKDISVTTRDKDSLEVGKDIQLTVVVEGEQVEDLEVQVPISSQQLNISAPDGYDVRVRGDGVSGVSPGLKGNWNITFGIGDPHITVGIEKETNNADYLIADADGNEYGTFSWNRQSAEGSAYPRLVTVNVNGAEAYSQYVHTPVNLSNANANREFWFTPNTLKYKVDSVELDPDDVLTLASGMRDLTVNLETCCQCGSPLCLCEGGASCNCPEGCTCDACQGVVGENQINTGYGIISYRPQTEDGYKLSVQVYVNGEEAYATPNAIYIENDRAGNLGFEPADGYNYFTDAPLSSYQFISHRDAGTWYYSNGHLAFGGTSSEYREYDNILRIYLWTFEDYVTLNVDRNLGTEDHVRGYTVSFEALDPRTNTYRTYTYEATSFAADTSQIIPAYTTVTLTATCTPGIEVDRWYSVQGHGMGVDFTGIDGGAAGTGLGDEAYGNTAYLTVNSQTQSYVQVYIDEVKQPKPPTEEEVIEALDEAAVKVECASSYVSHESATYGLTEGTFEVGEVKATTTECTVDVTVTDPQSYIDQYNASLPGHELVDENQDMVITFYHDGTGWKVVDGESPLVLEVMCDDAPDAPTDEQIKELIGDVKVDCVNDEAFHVTGTYALQDGYELGEVTGDVESGFTVTVSVPADAYVEQYDTETNVEHELADASASPAVVTLENTGEGWKLQSGTPVVFEVVCENVPEVPTTDELDEIFPGGLVTVDCTNDEADPAHANETYAVLEGSYLFGELNSNGDGTFSVVMDVYPARYAQQYSIDTQVNHWLDPADQDAKQVTLTYANGAWTADDSAAITVTVTCDAETEVPPVPPTGDDLNGLEGADITVACVSDDSHEEKAYDPIAGAYSYGEVAKNDEGVYEVVMTVTPSEYVKRYVADTEVNHWLDEGEDVAKTLTLQYVDDAWVVTSEGIRYEVVCDAEPTPEPPTTDEVEALLADNAVSVTCVNDEVEHESATYGPMDYSYWIGQLTGDVESGYECLVTFASDKYVAAYDETTGANHALAEGEQAQKTIKFVWDAENGAWAVDAGANPVNFDVVCTTPAPEQPDLPGIDELPTIFGAQGAVLIDCVNTEIAPAHADATYDIKAASYGWENYGADDNGQYTVDLRVSPYAYVADYNKANGAHTLTADSADSKVITLAYDADAQAWKIAAGQPQQFAFEVVCETPQPEEPVVPELPTDDEVQRLFADGLVSIECTTEGVEHELKTYKPIAEGGYAFGEVKGNVEDGATVEMTVFPQAYVGAYEADCGNIPHALNDGQSAATVTLTYASGAWSVAEDFAPIAYTVFCTICPVDSTPDVPTIDEVNDLFVDGAVKVTCVNEEADHGSESYELKNGYVTIGNVYGSETEGWKVDVTAAPGQYVLDFQTAKGVHHTLSPDDQGAQTITLNFAEDGWALPTADAQFEFTVVCADEPGADDGDEPGTDLDKPGTDDGDEPGTDDGDEDGDEPGTNPGDEDGDEPGDDDGDEPGTNPGDEDGNEPGDNDGNKPGDNQSGDNGDDGSKPGTDGNGDGTGQSGNGLAQTSDPVSFVASLMVALGGASALGVKSALDKRNK